MKITEKKKVFMSGMGKSVTQGISTRNMARATYFLRDRIYTDKLKAAVTEPLCNAVDEHKKHNIERPVDVFLCDGELAIRDYALGLSEEDVDNVFFQYFESTKDTSNDSIGGFGIGAKAPGAYTSQYYVESRHNGHRMVFVSVVQGYEAVVNKVLDEECDPNDTGIAVRVPIASGDRSNMVVLLKDLYSMLGNYSDKPVFNIKNAPGKKDYAEVLESGESGVDIIDSPMVVASILRKGDKDTSEVIEYNRIGELPKDKAIITNRFAYFPGEALVFNGEFPFNYSMFKNRAGRVLFYDGDLVYKANLTNDQEKLVERELGRKTYYSSNDDHIVFFFERGQLDMSPSRETIEQSAAITPLITKTLASIKKQFLDYVENDLKTDVFSGNEALESAVNRLQRGCLSGIVSNIKSAVSKNAATVLEALFKTYDAYTDSLMYGYEGGSQWNSKARIVEDVFEGKINDDGTVYASAMRFSNGRYPSKYDFHGKAIVVYGQRKEKMRAFIRGVAALRKAEDPNNHESRYTILGYGGLSEIKKILFEEKSPIPDAAQENIIKSLDVYDVVDVENSIPASSPSKPKAKASKPVQTKKELPIYSYRTSGNIGYVPETSYSRTLVFKKSDVNNILISRFIDRNISLPTSGTPSTNLTAAAQEVYDIDYISVVSAAELTYWEKAGAQIYSNDDVWIAKAKKFVLDNNIILLGYYCDNIVDAMLGILPMQDEYKLLTFRTSCNIDKVDKKGISYKDYIEVLEPFEGILNTVSDDAINKAFMEIATENQKDVLFKYSAYNDFVDTVYDNSILNIFKRKGSKLQAELESFKNTLLPIFVRVAKKLIKSLKNKK